MDISNTLIMRIGNNTQIPTQSTPNNGRWALNILVPPQPDLLFGNDFHFSVRKNEDILRCHHFSGEICTSFMEKQIESTLSVALTGWSKPRQKFRIAGLTQSNQQISFVHGAI